MNNFFNAKGKVLNNFKSRLFPIKYLDKIPTPELPTKPTQQKKFILKSQQEFTYEIIADKRYEWQNILEF